MGLTCALLATLLQQWALVTPQTIKTPLVLCRRRQQIETPLDHSGVPSTLGLFSSTLLR